MKILDLMKREWKLYEEEGYTAKYVVECQPSPSCSMKLRFEDREDAEALMFLLENAH